MKKIFKTLAIIVAASMVLAGCSHHKNEAPAVDTVSDASYTTTGSSSSTLAGAPGASGASGSSGAYASSGTKSEPVTNSVTDTGSASGESDESAVSSLLESIREGSFDTSATLESSEAWSADDSYVYYEMSDSLVESKGSADYDPAYVEPIGTIVDMEEVTLDPEGCIEFPIEPIDPIEPIEPIEPYIPEPEPNPTAGLLTAGEWNDNHNFDFIKNLIANGQDENYRALFTNWGLYPFNRLTVHATYEDGSNVVNATVIAYDSTGTRLWSARTDYNGTAYLYYNLFGSSDIPATVTVASGDVMQQITLSSNDLLDEAVTEVSMGAAVHAAKTLDLMFVIDTTGSMGDEISYLQAELDDVITRVSRQNANLGINLSVNFYRDLGDDYVVRSYPFSQNIDQQLSYLRIEYASGGGDYEEAVEMALDDAVNAHQWNDDSIKLMFIVLDAPPHNTGEIKASLAATIERAAEMGIRIIPIASSGVDKSTEFLLRTLSMATGGTYTFLTDDSGIGYSHLEPTVGNYDVENLNDMLVRIINEYLK